MTTAKVLKLASPLMALALGSCSYAYALQAVTIGGRLAFVVDPSSDYHPDCVQSVSVSADEGAPTADPASMDDRRLVLNGGVYWWKVFDTGSCENPFPLFYGAPLRGISSKGRRAVDAKPLQVGVAYEVNTTSNGSGSGTGWFRIRPDRQVENLPGDPTPPVRNPGSSWHSR